MHKYNITFNFLSSFLAPLFLTYVFTVHTMENYSHNTYKGTRITPQSLLTLVPKMPDELQEQVSQCVKHYQDFITQLVTTPHPLTHENRKQKTANNNTLLALYDQKNEVKNFSTFNYVLQFKEYPSFSMPINRWGSRMAYWIYASNQGSVLDPNFKEDFDCSLCEHIPSYQHCSRAAHYLRLKEFIKTKNCHNLRATPTYLEHIPNQPEELSDENYVVIQEWIENLKELKQLPLEEKTTIIRNISPFAMQEIHDATIYAGLWDTAEILAVDGQSSCFHLADLEEPFNHKPQFFYFQGDEGKKKYVEDVVASLERMAKLFLSEPEQFNKWKQLTEANFEFNELCREYNIFPNYDKDYLENRKY